MYAIIEQIVLSGIECIIPLMAFRILMDYTRIFLFKD